MITSTGGIATINNIAARHGEGSVDMFFKREEKKIEGNKELGEKLKLSRATILLLEANKIDTIETLKMQTGLSLIKLANMKEVCINEIIDALGNNGASLAKEFPDDIIPDECTLHYILGSGHRKTQKKLRDLGIITRGQLKNHGEIQDMPELSSIIALIDRKRYL